MKKKGIIGLVIGLLLLTAAARFVMANELSSLRGVVQRALTENTRIKLAELNVEKANRKYDNTMDQMDFIARMFEHEQVVPGSIQEEEFMRMQFVGRESAEAEKELAQRQKEDEQNKLAVETQQQYLNLIRTKKQKQLLEANLERVKDLKRLAEVSYKAGTVARSEVMRAEAHLANMEVALLGAESGVKIAEAALNMTTGYSLDNPVVLDESFTLPEVGEIHDLEQATRRAFANRIEMARARSGLTVADRMLVYARNRFAPHEYEYSIAELSLDEARLHLKTAEDGIRLEVFILHQALTGAEKKITAREKSLALSAENYRISKLRYELGVATQGEVMDAMLALSEQEMNLLNDRVDYYLDYLNWRLKTGLSVN